MEGKINRARRRVSLYSLYCLPEMRLWTLNSSYRLKGSPGLTSGWAREDKLNIFPGF